MKVETAGGTVIELGTTETAPTIGIIDYSRRVTDDFGVTTVVQRGFSRRMSVKLAVPFDAVDDLQRLLAGLRATPATWMADERFQSLSFEGFYKDFEIDLNTRPLSFCTLTVEGLAATDIVADDGSSPAPDGAAAMLHDASLLRLLQPATITGAVLTASNVAETDAAEWASGTTYALGGHVIKAATHRLYESVVAGNVGNDPAGVSGKWLDLGPTNRWAMFDQALGTATSRAGSIVVTLDAGEINGVALLDVMASTVRVQASGYDETITAGAGAITFLDMPTTDDPVTVTISGSGTVSVGTLLIGKVVALGITEASPTAGITDFSRKEVDDFGEVTVVQRAWAKRMTARALLRTDAVDTVANRIAAVRARPSLWVGQAGLDSLTIYGFFKDFAIEVGENVSKLSLSIEGLSTAAPIKPLAPDLTGAVNTVSEAIAAEVMRGVLFRDETDDLVRTADGTLLRQVVSTLGIDVDGVKSFVQDVRSVDEDGNLKALTTLNAAGHVIGTYLTNDGTTGKAYTVADEWGIIDPADADDPGALPTKPLYYVGGRLYAGDLTVTKLRVNTAMVPARAKSAVYVSGLYSSLTGTAEPRSSVLSVTVSVPAPGWIEATAKLQQGFVTDAPWFASIAVNGEEQDESYTGGGGAQDTVPTQMAYFAETPGDYTISLMWAAHTSVTLRERSMFVKHFPDTE